MASRVNFKLDYNGTTHRFASTYRDVELLRVVRIKVASILGSEEFDLFWKDEDSDIVLDTVDDLFAAVDFAMATRTKPGKSPRVLLVVVVNESQAAASAADIPLQRTHSEDWTAAAYAAEEMEMRKEKVDLQATGTAEFRLENTLEEKVHNLSLAALKAETNLQVKKPAAVPLLRKKTTKEKAADAKLRAASALQALQKEGALRKPTATALPSFEQEEKGDAFSVYQNELAEMQKKKAPTAGNSLFSKEQIVAWSLQNPLEKRREAAAEPEEEEAMLTDPDPSFLFSPPFNTLPPSILNQDRSCLARKLREIGIERLLPNAPWVPAPPLPLGLPVEVAAYGQATEVERPGFDSHLRPYACRLPQPRKEHEKILEANMRELASRLDAMNAVDDEKAGKDEYRTDSEGEWEEVEAKVKHPLTSDDDDDFIDAEHDWEVGDDYIPDSDDDDDDDEDDDGESTESPEGEDAWCYDDCREDNALSVSSTGSEEFGDFVGPTAPEPMHPLSAFVQVKKADGSAPKFEPMHPLSTYAAQPVNGNYASREEELAMREKALEEREIAFERRMAEFEVKMEAMEEKMERLGKRVARVEMRKKEEEPEKKKAKDRKIPVLP